MVSPPGGESAGWRIRRVVSPPGDESAGVSTPVVSPPGDESAGNRKMLYRRIRVLLSERNEMTKKILKP